MTALGPGRTLLRADVVSVAMPVVVSTGTGAPSEKVLPPTT